MVENELHYLVAFNHSGQTLYGTYHHSECLINKEDIGVVYKSKFCFGKILLKGKRLKIKQSF